MESLCFHQVFDGSNKYGVGILWRGELATAIVYLLIGLESLMLNIYSVGPSQLIVNYLNVGAMLVHLAGIGFTWLALNQITPTLRVNKALPLSTLSM